MITANTTKEGEINNTAILVLDSDHVNTGNDESSAVIRVTHPDNGLNSGVGGWGDGLLRTGFPIILLVLLVLLSVLGVYYWRRK